MFILEMCAVCTAAAKLLNPCLPCVAPIQAECVRNVELFVSLDPNLRSLENAESGLIAMKDQVEKESRDQNLERKPQVTQWLHGVEEALNRSPLLEEYQGLKRCACCCCCCNVVLSSDCQLHRKAKEKLDEVNQLMEQGNKLELPDPMTRRLDAANNLSNSPLIFGMPRLLEPLWSEFQNENRSVIGVFGPGGVGKTTLLKEFKKQVESKQEYKDAVVIFIEVANSADMLNVTDMQEAITSQLNIEWDQSQGEKERATLLLNLLSGKKFVVVLDAVWKSFQLKEVGIPYPANGSKLIVASWSESVCTKMDAKNPIEMKGLEGEEAMQLFMSNLKEDLQAKIKENSRLMSSVEVIVTRCGGLPLALNVLGWALACSHYPEVLENAESEMCDNSELPNFDILMYALKCSYNELDTTTKECFLYCVLFPDHGSIDNQLLQDYWVAEGLISGSSRAPHPGFPLISILISACLLQSSDTEPASEVKMHYMIRKMGIWLAKKKRYMIEAGRGLRRAPAAEKWEKATRISLMSNRIEKLSISPKCPALKTLLLRNNPSLRKLDSNLFRRMPRLKVLDLSLTAIDRLPDCGALRQLAYLNLSHTNIKELPRDICDNLGELLYLNMSRTRLTELPSNLCKLQMLTHLILSETSALKRIPNGTISKLLDLRVLNLYKSHYGILELPDLNLDNLVVMHTLGITIHSEPVLDKLRNNQLLANCTHFLSLSDCQGMQSIQISTFENMQKLEELNIESCNGLQSIDAGISENGGSLKVLNLKILSDLHKVVVPPVGHHFCLLRHLAIHACHKLVNVSWILQLHSLERLEISDCSELEEIALEQSDGATYMTSTTGEPQEEINAAAASTTCASSSNLQGRDACSSQNGVAVAIARLQSERTITTVGGTNIGDAQEEINGLTFTDAKWQEQDASSSQTSSGEPQEEMSAAAATTTISSYLQGQDASTSQNGGWEANVQHQNNKIITTVGGTNIGDPQEEINGSTFTDVNRQEQNDRAAPRSNIVCEIQEEIDATPSIQANKQDNVTSYVGANLLQTHRFDRLRIIVLKDLSKLKSICTTSDFPCLVSINVRACPILRNLPVGSRMPKLKQIHGERDWWDRLPPEMKDCLRNSTFIVC